MARRFFRDTGPGDRPANVGLFRPSGSGDGPGDGADGDSPRGVPREAADEAAPPRGRSEDVGRFPEIRPRDRPGVADDDRPSAARPDAADEPPPTGSRLRNIGLFRPANRGGRLSAEDDGDGAQAVPREPAGERPAPAAGGGESPPQAGPRPPQDTRSVPPEAMVEPPEAPPRTRTVSWQTQENSWLHGRVGDLERRLRRRTVALGVSALAAVAALASLTVVLLRDPEPPATAWTDSIAGALSDPRVPSGGEQQATASQDDAATVRTALSAAMARIEELEAAGGEREATIAELRAEAQALRERLDVSRQGVERLNALLARAVGADPSAAPPAPAEVELSAAAPVPAEAAAPDPPAEGDGPRTAGGDLYITTSAVNLRAEPTTGAAVLAVIDDGELVRRVASEGEWVQVEHADAFVGVVVGWVYGDLVRPAAATPEGG